MPGTVKRGSYRSLKLRAVFVFLAWTFFASNFLDPELDRRDELEDPNVKPRSISTPWALACTTASEIANTTASECQNTFRKLFLDISDWKR